MAEEFLTLMADLCGESQARMSAWYAEVKKAGIHTESLLNFARNTSTPMAAVTVSQTRLSLRILNCPDKSSKSMPLPSAWMLKLEVIHSKVWGWVGTTVFLREAHDAAHSSRIKNAMVNLYFTLSFPSISVPVPSNSLPLSWPCSNIPWLRFVCRV